MPKQHGNSKYTKKLANEICKRMAEGESVSSICADKHMPAKATVTNWKLKNTEGFGEQYTHAHEARQEFLFSELLEIADDGRNDWMERENGSECIDSEHIQRSKLRIETRKWQLSKMNPKLYGDKTQLTGADGDGPVKVEAITRTIINPENTE